ncbi:hypothetical protein Ae706Ps2_6236c [Pseudonocardia sp. Ae706_Ps2]|nr:hypothetical protein Ae706Ps2_6229c [Pseudonocardia sp. Ae706_Ps2]OLM09774.1 hypothetical protein Ae706Ps2_6236c [Pseudonocardia sp. Ae706_Ps2]
MGITAIAVWCVLAIAFLSRLLVNQPARRRPTGNLLVAALFLMAFTELRPIASIIDSLASGLDRLLANIFLLLAFLSTTLFFTACQASQLLLARPAAQASVAVLASIGLIVCWAASPVGMPRYPDFLDGYEARFAPVYLFYLTGNFHFAYCCALLAWSSYRAVIRPATPLRWASCLALVSSTAMLIGGPVIRIIVVATAWGTTSEILIPADLLRAEQLLLKAGILGFIGSLCAFAIQIFRAYRREQLLAHRKSGRLKALWEELAATVPGVHFKRRGATGRVSDLLLRDTQFLYGKIFAECEYGLWLVSEYVVTPSERMTLKQQALAVYEALVRFHRGKAIAADPVPIAQAAEDDDRPLLVFAAEFAKLVERYGSPRNSTIA